MVNTEYTPIPTAEFERDLRLMPEVPLTEHDFQTKITDLGGFSSEVFDKRRLQGYELPYKDLNKLIGGVRLSTCTILAGATNMGKSIVSLNLAVDLAKSNVPVCYIDLENGFPEVLERVVRIWYGLTGDFFDKEENMEDFNRMLKDAHDLEILSHEILKPFAKQKNSTLTSVLKAVVDNRAKKGYKVFFIDPLQALEESIDQSKSLNEQGKIIEDLKDLSQKHNVAIIINHHIRKATNGGSNYLTALEDVEEPRYRIPNLDDIKGSAKITDFATDVWAMVRTNSAKKLADKGRTLFRVLKSRRKGTGDVRMYIDMSTLKLFELKDVQGEFFAELVYADSE